MINLEQALGIDDSHISFDNELNTPVHSSCIDAIKELQQQSRNNGFDLRIASGFRSFDRQLAIWNAKATGAKAIYDDNNSIVDISRCSEIQLIQSICRWSAIPGASSHHWGSDFDIYDAVSLDDNALQLTDNECLTCFSEFYQWLDSHLHSISGCMFDRPYTEDTGGIGRELWHLSYKPIAEQYRPLVTCDALKVQLEQTDIAVKQSIIDSIEWLYRRYVLNLPHE